jgi:hypothetical protein
MTREWLLNDNITPAATAAAMMQDSMPERLKKPYSAESHRLIHTVIGDESCTICGMPAASGTFYRSSAHL